MDRDELVKQIASIQKKLLNVTPGTDSYDQLTKELKVFGDLLRDFDKSEFEREKLDREYELKSRDQDIESERIAIDKHLKEEDQRNERARIKMEEDQFVKTLKKDKFGEILKVGTVVLLITGTGGLVILIGAMEDTCVFKSKAMPLVTKILSLAKL